MNVYEYPPVVLGEVSCPLDDCDASIAIRSSLIIEEDTDQEEGMAVFRVGTRTDTSAIELHMVEHGLDPREER